MLFDRRRLPQVSGEPAYGHRVYVIDDEPDLRESACFLLDTLGISCNKFSSGDAFLKAVPALDPGVLLLDIRMFGLSGLDVQNELARLSIDWPIIFISGHVDTSAMFHGLKNGAIEFLLKPFSEEDLLAALHQGFRYLKERESCA